MIAPVSSAAVDTALTTLRDRVAKELGRLDAPSTMRVGGLARVAGNLDQLMRALAEEICDEQGLGADQWLTNSVGSRSTSLSRSTAWQIAVPLRQLVSRPSRRGHRRAWILDDIDSSSSAIKRVVDLRNPVLHGEREPDEASMRAALQPLHALLVRHVPGAGIPGWKPPLS